MIWRCAGVQGLQQEIHTTASMQDQFGEKKAHRELAVSQPIEL